MAKKIQESKEKKALKASSGSRKDKKKWSDTKKKEDVRRAVTVSEDVLVRVRKDIARASAVTRYAIGSKYNLNLGVAENVLRHLSAEGVVERVRANSRMTVYAGCAVPQPAQEQ